MAEDPLLALIPGDDSTRATNLNRVKDVEANIQNVKREFVGKPLVCHELIKHIIYLRREINVEENKAHFYNLLNNYFDTLIANYDVRWLISICDTIVDIGDSEQSAIAMNIVQCITQCNIHNTLLVNAVDGRLDMNKMQRENKVRTWGGMITMDIPTGDTIHNMMLRMDKVIARDELCNKLWSEIKRRGKTEQNVVLNHVCAVSRFPNQREFFK